MMGGSVAYCAVERSMRAEWDSGQSASHHWGSTSQRTFRTYWAHRRGVLVKCDTSLVGWQVMWQAAVEPRTCAPMGGLLGSPSVSWAGRPSVGAAGPRFGTPREGLDAGDWKISSHSCRHQ